MKRSFLPRLLPLVAALAAVTGAPLRADTPALSFTGGVVFGSGGSLTSGWSFTLTSTVQVTSLGYYDYDANGLNEAHPVGIFDSIGTLLTSTTVPAGTATTAINNFRYEPISAYTLQAGTYTIGGFTQSGTADLIAGNYSTLTTTPGVTYLGARDIGSSSLAFAPTNVNPPNTGYFGPNFQVAPAAATVPDAGGTLLLLGLSVSGLLTAHRLARFVA